MDENEDRFILIERSFDSLLQGKQDSVIFLKFLFKFVEMEGYPVREDWFRSLHNKKNVKTVLTNQTGSCVDNINEVLAILDSLILWMKESTDFYGLDE